MRRRSFLKILSLTTAVSLLPQTVAAKETKVISKPITNKIIPNESDFDNIFKTCHQLKTLPLIK